MKIRSKYPSLILNNYDSVILLKELELKMPPLHANDSIIQTLRNFSYAAIFY
jgi:hypothetical protein